MAASSLATPRLNEKIRGVSVWIAPDIIAALDAFVDRFGYRACA